MAPRVKAVLLAVAVAGGIACKQRQADVNGIGPYVLGTMKLSDAQVLGRCTPDGDIMWCFLAREIPLGDQSASVDLYFRGTKPDAPLDEIILEVRACHEEQALAALVKALGEPDESPPRRRIWRRQHAFILGRFRDGETSCQINFVDPSDQKRIDDLRKDK